MFKKVALSICLGALVLSFIGATFAPSANALPPDDPLNQAPVKGTLEDDCASVSQWCVYFWFIQHHWYRV